MADRTTPKLLKTRPNSGRDSFPIATTVRLAPGTLVQLSGGYADHWDDAGAGSTFLGIAISGDNSGNATTDDPSTWLGDTTGLPNPDPEVHVDTSGVTLMHLDSVAGTVTQATVGDLVYSADSDTDISREPADLSYWALLSESVQPELVFASQIPTSRA